MKTKTEVDFSKWPLCLWIEERFETVAPPCADSEKLASKGKRVLLCVREHSGEVELKMADMGILTSGWVVAIIPDEATV